LLHLLQSDDLFIDIGSNIGSYSILSAAVCGAQTIAIEPDPESAAFLKRNLIANNVTGRAIIYEAAMGDHAGFARLTVGHDTMNRISISENEESRSVRLITLDQVAVGKKPTLIKMDVEGFEAGVVAGGHETFKKPSLLAIITECADKRVRDPLEAFGFQQYYYNPFMRSISLYPCSLGSNNTLFIRDLPTVQKRLKQAPRRRVAWDMI
jgi:FkbM family methyltransferase